jgi:hypothetical protein
VEVGNTIAPIKLIELNRSDQPTSLTELPHLSKTTRHMQKIYNVQGDLMVAENMEEAAKMLLTSAVALCPTVKRAILYLVDPSGSQLLPLASKDNAPKFSPFVGTDALFAHVLHSLTGASMEIGQDRQIVVLPMVKNRQVMAILHCHFEKPHFIKPTAIELFTGLLKRVAPLFENLILRKDANSYLLGMAQTIISVIEAKDTYTVGHSERVCKYSMAIANNLKLHKDVKKMLMISSLCHDIGKVGIPDEILKKASLLSSEEYAEMKLHPVMGANIISSLPHAQQFLSGIKHHHEKWDGTGYPDGLEGENIPFFGRIVAVADVFDAMISGRSYSGFIDESDAIDKIQAEVELFDPEIVKALVRAFDDGEISQRSSTQAKEEKPSRY